MGAMTATHGNATQHGLPSLPLAGVETVTVSPVSVELVIDQMQYDQNYNH